jgi:hypothetical protein
MADPVSDFRFWYPLFTPFEWEEDPEDWQFGPFTVLLSLGSDPKVSHHASRMIWES